MKKIMSMFGCILLSLLLFLGGTSIDAEPTRIVVAEIRDLVDDTEDPDPQDLSVSDPGMGQDPEPDVPDMEKESETEDAEEEPDILEETSGFLYYYSLLNMKEKSIYDQVSRAVAGEESSTTLNGVTYEDANRIFISVYNDHPEYFWMENSYMYRESVGAVELLFNYNCTGDEKKQKEDRIKEQALAVLAQAPLNGSDYEKVKYVYETIVNKTQYDLSAPDNQNIYSVFGNWVSVCSGYAKASKYLLDRMGVDCLVVVGEASGEAHAWNIVMCDGVYYGYDATWGDPLYLDDVADGRIAYEYLCCPDAFLTRTHTSESMFLVPECTDNSLEYYRMRGRYLDSAEEEQILSIMKSDIDNGEASTTIQFSDSSVYSQAMAELDSFIQDALEYMSQTAGRHLDNVSYQYYDGSCVVTVIWK